MIEQVSALIIPKFRPWFCGAAHKLGPKTMLDLAGSSREGADDPRKVFANKVKLALNAHRVRCPKCRESLMLKANKNVKP